MPSLSKEYFTSLYGTTRLFLERFGLKSLRELPSLEDFAPDEESKQFIRERLSGRQMESTLEDAMDDIEDERELLGCDLGETDGETGFSPDHDMYADDVYAHAAELLRKRVADGTLVRDGRPCYYLYRLEQDGREQTGIVAACSLDDYNNGVIRRHESTRRAKEEDRVRHIRATGCQTGPIFLAYRDNPALEALVEAAKGAEPLYDFTDGEGVRQTVWRVARPAAVEAFQMMLTYIPRAYIADGHHRAASAARVCQEMRTEEGREHTHASIGRALP